MLTRFAQVQLTHHYGMRTDNLGINSHQLPEWEKKKRLTGLQRQIFQWEDTQKLKKLQVQFYSFQVSQLITSQVLHSMLTAEWLKVVYKNKLHKGEGASLVFYFLKENCNVKIELQFTFEKPKFCAIIKI